MENKFTSNPPVFEKRYELRLSDFDRNDEIRPAALAELFQDAGGIHAGLLDAGTEVLRERSACWMILRNRLRVESSPAVRSGLTVRTWPIYSPKFEFERDYEMIGDDGSLVARGSSVWAILDVSDRSRPRVTPARNFDFGIEKYEERRSFPDGFPRLSQRFEGRSLEMPLRACDIDANGHVNNAKYFDLISEAYDGRRACEWRIDYLRELLPGGRVTLVCGDGEGGMLVRGESADGGTVNFLAKVDFD